MQLNDLKQVARRLRNQSPEQTQAQALEQASQLLGFRSYFDAKRRFSQGDALSLLALDPGGLLGMGFMAANLGKELVACPGHLAISGGPGTGKTVLAHELILQALFVGRPVRILDAGGSFRNLTVSLKGTFAQGTPSAGCYESWRSTDRLVCLDTEGVLGTALDAAALAQMPRSTMLVIDEFWQFDERIRALPANKRVLVGQCAALLAGEEDIQVNACSRYGAIGASVWDTAGPKGPLRAHLLLGPARVALMPPCARLAAMRDAGPDLARAVIQSTTTHVNLVA